MIIVYILLVVAFLVTSLIIIREVTKSANKKAKIPIQFKESMDLLNVPVVTFVNNGVKLHFLLDTGADYSYLDKEALDLVKAKEKSKDSINISTGIGSCESTGKVTLDITYKDHNFEETFVVGDFKKGFESAFGSYGVQVHGTLGSMFFAKYKYEINFENLIAYSSK